MGGLITNFHLPRSTLLMLVAAFGGYERTMEAYGAAIREGCRFYSGVRWWWGDHSSTQRRQSPRNKATGLSDPIPRRIGVSNHLEQLLVMSPRLLGISNLTRGARRTQERVVPLRPNLQ